MRKFLEEVKLSFIDLIKNDLKYVISLVLIAIICFMPMNYYIIVGGGISDIASRVVVEDGYKSKGSLNISYVTEADGKLLTYLLSYVMPNWKRVSIDDYKYESDESPEDIMFRNNLNLKVASSNAISVAYLAANKNIEVSDTHVYVVSVMKEYEECKLKVGDEIEEIDGKKIESTSFSEYINTKKENDYVEFKIIRNNKEKIVKSKIYKEDDRLLVGVYLSLLNDYKTTPNTLIKFKKEESGPSGGLMTALSIYNQLTKDDITKGLKIAGTGTIDSDGSIGQIGEVKYKVLGAVAGKADIFLVPAGENYKEVLEVVEEDNLKIKVIPVETFDEAISELKNI